ncbi:peptide-methionine (R)-S-oxide reductase MsrB [Sphingomonas jaspsi]|uniref:peptide-methionine (R)-S-oxide reductase MsrB n=1 Tax=Sphingomonas jaspsi TaxID=392409 RepID=UPI0004BC0DB1|nr:peptide-methionine (R)-S-oxide reductase MsrB [Sphingomonas jaspsi]
MGKDKRSETEWQATLSPEQYRILRQAGTEPPFTGALLNNKAKGKYVCGACGEPLFDSDTKYDSGSGWPSFTAPLSGDAVEEHMDDSHGMRRVEVRCAKCEGHLGHVFPDGPGANGLRYCINSASLGFDQADKDLDEG